jgi:probable HAF family extracellular repeat protein
LGDFDDDSVRSTAIAVSGDGTTVVGFGRGNALAEPALWREGKLTSLGKLDLEGDDHAWAHAVSADGRVIVGEATATEAQNLAVVWHSGDGPTRQPLPQGFSSAYARAVSGNGKVVGGSALRPCEAGTCEVAVLWREGRPGIVTDASGKPLPARIEGLSQDGSVAVGSRLGDPSGFEEAFLLTRGKVQWLGKLPGSETSSAHAVSADGHVVVGESWPGAFRWERGRMESLGKLPGFDQCFARAVSADGARIVGNCVGQGGMRSEAFLWEKGGGIRSVMEALAQAGAEVPAGWQLNEAFGISADGATVVGDGSSARGHEAWKAVIPRSPPRSKRR